MKTPKYIARLAAKRLSGTLTVAEEQELQAWADSTPAYREWLDGLHWESIRLGAHDQSAYKPVEDAWDNPRLKPYVPRPGAAVRRIGRWLPYAAAILIASTVAIWAFFGDRTRNRPPAALQVNQTGIMPGGNRATLTLSDGRTIALSSEQQGIVVQDGITYLDGTVVLGDSTNSQTHTLALTTPKGGTYQITLPDGSRVWLNAASTLRYPSRFTDHERVVELSGEAFFSIRSQPSALPTGQAGIGDQPKAARLPFRVMTKGQTVEVLGTAFNISAYVDDSETKTTLVEGRVRLEANGASLQLAPGEQGVSTKNGLSKHEINTQPYTAWKDGKFAFTGKPFGQAIGEIARWYDLEVVYTDGIPDETLFGGAYRNENLSIILQLLTSHRVDYQLSGKQLIIQNKNKGKEDKP